MSPIAFGVVAACLMLAALLVVTTRNLVHSVLWLAVTLLSTAALYALLGAGFLAGIQVLLYTGGVITLMLFGVMLTRRHERVFIENQTAKPRRGPALFVAAALFGIMAAAIRTTSGLPNAVGVAATTEQIGSAFLTEHLLAFEVLSILLLAAMIGAIVLARRSDFGQERERALRVRKGRAA
jgi:NADH-quinone oxidoreductase subunit J